MHIITSLCAFYGAWRLASTMVASLIYASNTNPTSAGSHLTSLSVVELSQFVFTAMKLRLFLFTLPTFQIGVINVDNA